MSDSEQTTIRSSEEESDDESDDDYVFEEDNDDNDYESDEVNDNTNGSEKDDDHIVIESDDNLIESEVDEVAACEKKPVKSAVWNFVDKNTRKCMSCDKVFEKTTSTSSIRIHLKNHGILSAKENQETIDNFVKQTKSDKTQAVIEWIILDMQPFKVVEGKAFHKMLSNFDPNYQLPSRNTIKNFIIKSFEKRKITIKNYIKNIPGKVSLTVDIWSSLKSESFLGITIHFISDEWSLKHFTLDIFRIKGSHTGQLIADEIYKVLVEFNLENKAISITTDNATNVVASTRILKTKFQYDFIHFRCIAHILNLVVTSGLDVINIQIKKLRKLIKTIKKSSKMIEELENLAKLDNKNFIRPILDCKTRWNSTYSMINRAYILKENMQMLGIKYPILNNYMLTEAEWELFYELDQFLEQFNKATIDLSNQSYPTIAHSRIILLAIKIDLFANRSNDSLLNDIIIPMREKFNYYYEVLKESTHIAAFLDPRYKKYCFPDMSEENIFLPVQQKLGELQQITLTRPPVKTSSFLQKLKGTSSIYIVDDEVNKYWNSNEASEDIKPLDWWKTHCTEYPKLAKLALDYLCIQASSVPCEQLFSITGQVLCKSRNRLTGESVRACICLRSWILENIN